MNNRHYPRDHRERMEEWQQAIGQSLDTGLQAYVRRIVKARLLEYCVSNDVSPDSVVDAALTEWFQKRGF